MKVKELLKETSSKIQKPWLVRLESSRGCNTGCTFCAIHTIPKEREFMTIKVAMKVAKSLSEFGVLKFQWGLRGEPILNPNIIPIMKIFRKFNPKSSLMIYSNGIKLTKKLASDLFDAGVNCITIDCYTDSIYKRSLEEFKEFDLVDYYEQKGDFSPWARHKPSVNKICLLKDFGLDISGKKKTRVITNVAGNVDYEIAKKNNLHIKKLDKAYEKKCSLPFRDITIINNGKLILCCKDWSENKILFDIMEDERSLIEYWYNDETLNKIRLLLYNKNREFEPCKYCDFDGGMRLGFLPKLPILTEAEENKILDQVNNLDLENKDLENFRKENNKLLYYEK